jgi:hypothetical protein
MLWRGCGRSECATSECVRILRWTRMRRFTDRRRPSVVLPRSLGSVASTISTSGSHNWWAQGFSSREIINFDNSVLTLKIDLEDPIDWFADCSELVQRRPKQLLLDHAADGRDENNQP